MFLYPKKHLQKLSDGEQSVALSGVCSGVVFYAGYSYGGLPKYAGVRPFLDCKYQNPAIVILVQTASGQ